MEKIGQALPNVEELFVQDECSLRDENFNFELILGFKSLKTLKVEVDFMDLNSFLGTLRSIENVKASNLFVSFCMNGTGCWGPKWSFYDKDLDERRNFVQGLFQEAIKIIDENFPKDSTEFRIDDYGFKFVIRKYKGEAPERRDDIYLGDFELTELTDSDGYFDSNSDGETDDLEFS